jgi:hypothetical protein
VDVELVGRGKRVSLTDSQPLVVGIAVANTVLPLHLTPAALARLAKLIE